MALLVLDFDGTLVDSNALKRAAFRAAARDIAGAGPILDRLLAPPTRGDRAWVFDTLAGELGRPELASALAERYDALTREGILARLADGWADEFLALVAARGHRAHVNSATPHASLDAILTRSGLAGRLAGFRGGFGRKTENLRAILAAEGAATAVVVGDGSDDEVAARDCGCVFLRVDDGDHALFRMVPIDAVRLVESRECASAEERAVR